MAKWSVLHLLIPKGLIKEDSTTGGIVHLFRMTEKIEEVCEQVSGQRVMIGAQLLQ